MRLKILVACVVALSFGACTSKLIDSQKYSDVRAYKYAVVGETTTIGSSEGYIFGGNGGGFFGASSGKSINPADIISGILIKNGFIVVDKPINQPTLLVKYGQTDKAEVIISMIDSVTHQPVFMCRAYGGAWGDTNADDLRNAILKCLSEL